LPGGLDGGDITVNGLDPAAAFADFQGVQLTAGNLLNNGDQIVYVGQIDGANGTGTFYDDDLGFPIGYPPSLAAGQPFALFWFPGVTNPGATVANQPFPIGGFFNPNPNTTLSDIGMVLQSDAGGAVYNVYQVDAATAGSFGQSSAITNAAFSAVLAGPPADDFAAWIDGFFPNVQDPAIVGFTADPDRDGLTNGVEAALGTAPNATTSGLKAPAGPPGPLAFTATLAKDPPSDVSRAWQWSPNLTNWFASGASDGTTTVTFDDSHVLDGGNPDYNVVRVTASATGSSPGKLFGRLTASQSLAP
jgi:hypothetical protein